MYSLKYNQREEIFMKNCMKKIICFGLVFMMLFIVQGHITTYALENNKVSNSIVITSQPKAVTGKIGDKVEFSVGASGTNLKYQWQYIIKGQNSVDILVHCGIISSIGRKGHIGQAGVG